MISNHELQRDLCKKIDDFVKNDDLKNAKKIYQQLDIELKAHATGEERHLYIPVMQHDEGLDLLRHAIAEHHEMDEMMEILNDGRTSDENWVKTVSELTHKVIHHLKEEEQEFFKDAKKILDKDLQQRLGSLYQVEHAEFEKNNT